MADVCVLSVITGKTWENTFQRLNDLSAPIPFDLSSVLTTQVYSEIGGDPIFSIPTSIVDFTSAKWKMRMEDEFTSTLPTTIVINTALTVYFNTIITTDTETLPLITNGQLLIYPGVITEV